jgi:hypothetical protein
LDVVREGDLKHNKALALRDKALRLLLIFMTGRVTKLGWKIEGGKNSVYERGLRLQKIALKLCLTMSHSP